MILKHRTATVLPAFLVAICLVFSGASSVRAALEELYAEGEVPGQEAVEFDRTLAHEYPRRVNDEGARGVTVTLAGEWVSSQLQSFGYEVIEVPYVHLNYTGIDYAVVKPGADPDSYIVVSAHYDSVDTEGADDNGSGTSCVLEMAKRFRDVDTPLSIMFVLFDGEEHGGYVGSYHFLEDYLDPNELTGKIFANINIDSVGGGDRVFAYGGYYDEAGQLQNDWLYREANKAAQTTHTTIYTLSDLVEIYPTPTRVSGSDHHYFNVRGIPYIYVEASRWCLDDGSGGDDHTNRHYHFQSADPRLNDTAGQIMHTKYDNFDLLEELFPGRLAYNLGSVVTFVSQMLLDIDHDTPAAIMQEEFPLEAVTEWPTEEPTTEEPETEAETQEQTQSEQATEPGETVKDTASGSEGGSLTPGNHKMVRNIFLAAGGLIILVILFLVYISLTSAHRRRKRIHRKNSKSGRNKKF